MIHPFCSFQYAYCLKRCPSDHLRSLTQEFVEATKENSGLDLGNLNEQPGNRSKQALGEIQTPKGDVSGEYFIAH